MKRKLILLLLLGKLLPVHAQIPWKLEPFIEYFGHVRDSALGARVKGFVGSHSNSPFNVAVAESHQFTDLPKLRFYSFASPQDTIPRWTISGADVEHGDFNGDGLTDLAVWKSVNKSRAFDTVLVYLGNPAGIDTLPSYKLPAEQDRSAFGSTMCIGDVNNDGIDDLVITARDYHVQLGQFPQGKVYVHFGGDHLKPEPDFTITGTYAGARLGTRCAIADLNDDGFNDLAIRGSATIFEYLNVYFGSGAAFDTVADLTGPKSYRTIVSGLAQLPQLSGLSFVFSMKISKSLHYKSEFGVKRMGK